MKAIKGFFGDMWALQKESNKFLKKHWLGYLILCISAGLLEAAWLYRDDIADKAKEKLNRKEDSER